MHEGHHKGRLVGFLRTRPRQDMPLDKGMHHEQQLHILLKGQPLGRQQMLLCAAVLHVCAVPYGRAESTSNNREDPG